MWQMGAMFAAATVGNLSYSLLVINTIDQLSST